MTSKSKKEQAPVEQPPTTAEREVSTVAGGGGGVAAPIVGGTSAEAKKGEKKEELVKEKDAGTEKEDEGAKPAETQTQPEREPQQIHLPPKPRRKHTLRGTSPSLLDRSVRPKWRRKWQRRSCSLARREDDEDNQDDPDIAFDT